VRESESESERECAQVFRCEENQVDKVPRNVGLMIRETKSDVACAVPKRTPVREREKERKRAKKREKERKREKKSERADKREKI